MTERWRAVSCPSCLCSPTACRVRKVCVRRGPQPVWLRSSSATVHPSAGAEGTWSRSRSVTAPSPMSRLSAARSPRTVLASVSAACRCWLASIGAHRRLRERAAAARAGPGWPRAGPAGRAGPGVRGAAGRADRDRRRQRDHRWASRRRAAARPRRPARRADVCPQAGHRGCGRAAPLIDERRHGDLHETQHGPWSVWCEDRIKQTTEVRRDTAMPRIRAIAAQPGIGPSIVPRCFHSVRRQRITPASELVGHRLAQNDGC